MLRQSKATGARVHDARIAAICADHGVTTVLSAYRDFGKFPGIRVQNPLRG
jgi:predicted nucleic acid-binding protein